MNTLSRLTRMRSGAILIGLSSLGAIGLSFGATLRPDDVSDWPYVELTELDGECSLIRTIQFEGESGPWCLAREQIEKVCKDEAKSTQYFELISVPTAKDECLGLSPRFDYFRAANPDLEAVENTALVKVLGLLRAFAAKSSHDESLTPELRLELLKEGMSSVESVRSNYSELEEAERVVVVFRPHHAQAKIVLEFDPEDEGSDPVWAELPIEQ